MSARYLDAIAAHARHAPDRLAVRDERGDVSYGELWSAVERIAGGLRERGVAPGDRVATTLAPGAAQLALIFGAMAAGAVAAPLNIKLTPPEVRRYLEPVAPRLIVADATGAGLGDDPLVLPDGGAGPLSALAPLLGPPGRGLSEVDPAAPAILFGTGGTTGLPKAGCWTHRSLWLYAAACVAAMEVRRTDLELFFSPFFHIALVTGPFGTLFVGGACHFLTRFDETDVLRHVTGGTVTRFFGAPTALRRLVDHPACKPAATGAVRRILYGSTRSEPDLPARLRLAFPNAELITGYGATEFGAVARLRSWELVDGTDQGVGAPVPGVVLRIVDPAGAEVPRGEVGEIVVRAPWQITGYWGHPEQTAAARHAGGIRSGDLGLLDPDGFLHLRGRSKDLVITGGENVFPAEVEDALCAHPAIAAAAVFGRLDPEWGERVEAALVPVPGSAIDVDEVRRFCRERLAGYKVPKVFHVMDQLPLTATMKVDRRRLREVTGGA
ncbi:class I adenylate-forming enzyme family protein [Dactylosporangium sp. NPDC000555]|uniref:class I adenylate-forming enzyme family protein n=1 Tax=Dactylosporangium sp. NPDC000555 TaxID=3154260 RepID=UPI00332EB0AB